MDKQSSTQFKLGSGGYTMYYDLELFGKKIREIRSIYKYTQKDISEITTITTETMRKIENGKVTPNQITLELLSSVLKEDMNQLLLNFRISDYKKFYDVKDKIEIKLETGQYENLIEDKDKLNEILKEITSDNNYMYKLIMQLSLLVESIILKTNHQDYKNSLLKLIDAMRVTHSDFDLANYDSYVYSKEELRILMNISILMNILESKEKSLDMLKFISNALNSDEVEFKIKVFYNLSYSYHRNDIHSKALYYASEGITLCISSNNLNGLGLLYARKGIAEYFLKDNNYINSLSKAISICDITERNNLKEMLLKFCTKHNIELQTGKY